MMVLVRKACLVPVMINLISCSLFHGEIMVCTDGKLASRGDFALRFSSRAIVVVLACDVPSGCRESGVLSWSSCWRSDSMRLKL